MPIEKEMQTGNSLSLKKQVGGALLHRLRGLGREVLLLEGDDPIAVERAFRGLLNAFEEVLLIDEEPMMNIAGFHQEGKWRLVIFPRRKHRPEAFFKKGEARVVVSPGVIDMGGLLITPVKKDFEGLGKVDVEKIYGEVSLEAKTVGHVIEALA
jgi:hypothetical protein